MKVRLHIKFGISCILFSMVYVIQASAIDVKLTEFPIYPFDPVGKEKSQMKLTVDYVKYPDGTTDASFPTLDRRVPESVVAEWVRLENSQDDRLTDFLSLYLPDKKENAETNYKNEKLRRAWKSLKGFEFLRRYDVDNIVYISYDAEYAEKPKDIFFPDKFFYILKKIGEDYFINPVIDLDSLPVLLINGNEYAIWNSFRGAILDDYKYTLIISSPGQSAPPNFHPMKVSFNGTICKILIDEKTEPEDKITEFIKKVVLTYRNESDEEWFSLWVKDEAEEWVSLSKKEGKDIPEWAPSAAYPYQAERNRFDKNEKTFLLYKIDFGPNALVFYQKGTEVKKDKNGKITNVKPLYFWKDSNGKCQLTEGSSPGSNVTRFSGNIAAFFESELFLNFLMKQLQPQQSNVGK